MTPTHTILHGDALTLLPPNGERAALILFSEASA